MKHTSRHLKVSILCVLSVLGMLAPARAADDTMLDMVPADSLICVRINNLNNALSQMDQYLIGVSPISMAMMAKMQLMGIVGDPMLNGIDMNGSFGLVVLPDMTHGILVPVSDFDTFVTNNPNCTAGADGTATLSAPDSPMGACALAQAAGGKYAIVVPETDKQKLTALKAALGGSGAKLFGRLSKMQSQDAADAPVWAYFNLDKLYQQFGPMINAQLDQVETQMATEMGDMGSMGGIMSLYMQVYKGLLETFGKEADSATVALVPDPQLLCLDLGLRAKEGTELASMMVADPTAKQGFAYTGYLDTENAVNGLMKINRPVMKKFYDTIFDILANAKKDAAMEASVAKMKTVTNQWVDVMGNEMAVSFSYAQGPPPFTLREVVGLRDGAAADKVLADSLKEAGSFYQAIGLPMSFDYTQDVSSYKGATIDQIVLKFTQPETGTENDPMAAVMGQMYGEGLTYNMARSGDTLFVAMGPNTDIKQLIDETASAPATGEVKTIIDLFKPTPYNEAVLSINVIKLLTGLGDVMQTMAPIMGQSEEQMPPFKLFSELNLPSQSALGIGGYSANGESRFRVALPKQHLMEIMSAVTQIQQKVMQQMQQGMQQTPNQDAQP